MTSRSELTLFERGEIIGAWKCGLSEEKISVALKRAPSTHKPLPRNKEELWQILQKEWHNIDVSVYQNLVDSMPRRIAAVIKSKGYPTKYYCLYYTYLIKFIFKFISPSFLIAIL
jgi:hypothetical protein